MSNRQHQAGSSTTELVLLTPAVLFMVMLVVQAGLYWHARQVVDAAAQEALESAQVEFATAATGVEVGQAFLAEAGGVRDAVVEVARDAEQVTVQVSGTAVNVLPMAAWQVSAQAAGVVERFVPGPER